MLNLFFKPANIYIYAELHDGQPVFYANEIDKLLSYSTAIHYYNDTLTGNLITRPGKRPARIRNAKTKQIVVKVINRKEVKLLTINGVDKLINKSFFDIAPVFRAWFQEQIADLPALIARIKAAEKDNPILPSPQSLLSASQKKHSPTPAPIPPMSPADHTPGCNCDRALHTKYLTQIQALHRELSEKAAELARCYQTIQSLQLIPPSSSSYHERISTRARDQY